MDYRKRGSMKMTQNYCPARAIQISERDRKIYLHVIFAQTTKSHMFDNLFFALVATSLSHRKQYLRQLLLCLVRWIFQFTNSNFQRTANNVKSSNNVLFCALFDVVTIFNFSLRNFYFSFPLHSVFIYLPSYFTDWLQFSLVSFIPSYIMRIHRSWRVWNVF